jgi:hypothetical protein
LGRVIVPEGEILSFAPPKESIQRKGGSIDAQSALLGAANESKSTLLRNVSESFAAFNNRLI